MGAFFGACNMAGGCWGWRLGAFCEPRKPQEWVLEDEVNNWRWHFVEGYMLSTIGAWCEKDVIADQIPSTLDSASCVWHLRLAMAGVSFGLLEFRSPKLWDVFKVTCWTHQRLSTRHLGKLWQAPWCPNMVPSRCTGTEPVPIWVRDDGGLVAAGCVEQCWHQA